MPPGPNPFQAAGAKPSHETAAATLFHNRFFTGLWTQRNILRDPSGVVQERWYGGRGDALLDGVNVELTNRLTLGRAPGSTAYSTATLPQAANSFYSFKKFTSGTETITVMVDTPGVLYSINPTSKTTVLTKAGGAGPSFLIGVGNTLYIGDGLEQKAWTGIGTVRNWGIALAALASAVSNYAGTAADAGGGGAAWTNPTNAQGAPNTVYATASQTVGAHFFDAISNFLHLTNYGFAIGASDAINGVQLVVTGLQTQSSTFANLIAVLLYKGAVIGSLKTGPLPLSAGTLTLGGSSDTWGASLTPLIVNDATFGVRVYEVVNNPTGFSITNVVSIDAGQITIYHTGAPNVTLVAGGFSPAPAIGFKYVIAYGNSSSNGVSIASQQTGVMKPTATQSVQVALVASTDTQVNQIYVFRTADGGSVFGNIPGSPFPNTTANIVDSAADTTVSFRQLADLTGLNTPPPSGFTAFEFHQGRVWGAAGNTVYYSVGSDLGLILGNAYEGIPPANFFTFPSQVVRLLSVSTVTSSFLLVFTVSDVYAIYGNGSAAAAIAGVGVTVYFAAPFLRRVGLASYNALDLRGSLIYMMTNDGRVISFNASSQVVYLDPEKAINEIGFPIGSPPPGGSITLTGGTLANFTSSSAYVTWHGAGSGDQALYVADGSTGWFRCNPNQQPDGGTVWSTKRNVVGGCQAVQSIETSPGMFQLLIGPPTGGGSVLFRDVTTNNDNASAYPSNCRMGALILAHPGQLANPWFLTADFAPVGSQPTLSVLFDELDGAFTALVKTDNDPPHLAAPASVYANRYYIRQATSGTQAPSACRWMQLKVDFGATDTVPNELLTLSIFGGYEQEA